MTRVEIPLQKNGGLWKDQWTTCQSEHIKPHDLHNVGPYIHLYEKGGQILIFLTCKF